MNLNQLKALCEIIDHGFSISAASQSLFRTQPSVSRHIQELEKEIGLELFVRRRNKILDLTPGGQQVVAVARRMIDDAKKITHIAGDLTDGAKGSFTIATTHTQARYTLPNVIQAFIKNYPNVTLDLRQGTPQQCYHLVAQGKADIGICTNAQSIPEEVVIIPCYLLSRSVIVPPAHPLLKERSLTLEKIAQFPIITYDQGYSARAIVDEAFASCGIAPSIVLSAIDADVSKTYVEAGIGIAILATIAFNAKRDKHLKIMDARRLFPSSMLGIVVRRNAYLRSYMTEFIRLFAPKLAKQDIEHILATGVPARRRALEVI